MQETLESGRPDEVETEFIKDLRVALEQGADLYDIMQEPSRPFSNPGSIDDVFSMSAGKLDRSH